MRLALLLVCLTAASVCAQPPTRSTLFVAPEVMIGKAVDNYPGFPPHRWRTTAGVNVGWWRTDTGRVADVAYNYPHAGVSVAWSDLGNPTELGQEISVVPYVLLNVRRRPRGAWSFRLGLGASYFTRFYNEETNPHNQVIGARYNWTFQALLYHQWYSRGPWALSVGAGYWHSSNGHTRLPNYGLNSAVLSLNARRYLGPVAYNWTDPSRKKRLDRTTGYFLQVRSGWGRHAYGGTAGSPDAPRHNVWTQALAVGVAYRRHIRVRAGLAGRYYASYYAAARRPEGPEGPTVSVRRHEASAVLLFLGAEWLIGHVGMDVAGALNLYKPFYRTFYDRFERGNNLNFLRKRWLATRMGLNLYLLNPHRRPRHNVALGAHVNANFGKADFAELSLQYNYRLR